MPFEKGNKLGGRRKEKPARDALKMALLEAGEDMPALRKIWAKAIELAEAGDKDARKEIFDRLDGKPATIIEGDEDNPLNVINHIKRTLVRPEHPDG